MQIKVHVLTGRCGCDLLETSVSGNLAELRKKMKVAYKTAKNELDGCYEKEGTSCGGYGATIVTTDDWYEWVISTHII